jgi:retron-type reverse transcriptase
LYEQSNVRFCLKPQVFATSLLLVLNSCLHNNCFPNILKTAKIVPIPKIRNPTSPSQLRPISIQPVIANFFVKCLFTHFSSYLESKKIICPTQYGFRTNHATSQAVVSITDFIYDSIDKNEISILVTLDIRKAFDLS